jgi:hypothetical protein
MPLHTPWTQQDIAMMEKNGDMALDYTIQNDLQFGLKFMGRISVIQEQIKELGVSTPNMDTLIKSRQLGQHYDMNNLRSVVEELQAVSSQIKQ